MLSTEESTQKWKITKDNTSREQYEDTYVSVIGQRMEKKSGTDGYDRLDDSRSSQPRTLLEWIIWRSIQIRWLHCSKPLLIEFSISYRTVRRHSIKVNEYKRTTRWLPILTGIGPHLNRDGPNPKQLRAACRMSGEQHGYGDTQSNQTARCGFADTDWEI